MISLGVAGKQNIGAEKTPGCFAPRITINKTTPGTVKEKGLRKGFYHGMSLTSLYPDWCRYDAME